MERVSFRKKIASSGDRKIIIIPLEWYEDVELGTIYKVTLTKVDNGEGE